MRLDFPTPEEPTNTAVPLAAIAASRRSTPSPLSALIGQTSTPPSIASSSRTRLSESEQTSALLSSTSARAGASAIACR